MNPDPSRPVRPGLVLVVDDVEANRMLARAYLEKLGWEVRTVNDGEAALRWLQQEIPQAMLVDVWMPGLRGDRLARQLRQDPACAGMRLVGYTALAMPEEVSSFVHAGFDEVMFKPVLLHDMARALPPPQRA